MSTKAFTSALGYGVTIRGYIDEDDRLVLLEPEGGGGGDSGLATCNLTVKNTLGTRIMVSDIVTIEEDPDYGRIPMAGPFALEGGVTETYEIITVDGQTVCFIEDGTNYSVTGSAEAISGQTGGFFITGDATIEVS